MIKLNCYMMSGSFQTKVGHLRVPDAVRGGQHMRKLMRYEIEERLTGDRDNYTWMLESVLGAVPGAYVWGTSPPPPHHHTTTTTTTITTITTT